MTNARSAREKAAQMRAEAARLEARRRGRLVAASIAALLVVITAVAGIVEVARSGRAEAAAPPRHVVADGITVGPSWAKVTIVAYEDFQCPACRAFEQANAAQIKTWIDAGTVKVAYRPIAFLDRASTDGYSTRALNAAAAVIDSAPSAFPAFHQALFDNQPEEGGPGLTDARLVDLAVAAGAPRASVQAAVTKKAFAGWVSAVTADASKGGVNQTPTVTVNGAPVTDTSATGLKRAVEDAGAQ